MTEEKEAVENVNEQIPKDPIVVGPVRGGLMKRTLRELEMLEIKLKDILEINNMSINLGWEQIIKLANYNADKKVLNWDHTFEEALQIIKIFLF